MSAGMRPILSARGLVKRYGRVTALDNAVPALPALLWLALMVGRIALGPLVPRI